MGSRTFSLWQQGIAGHARLFKCFHEGAERCFANKTPVRGQRFRGASWPQVNTPSMAANRQGQAWSGCDTPRAVALQACLLA
jgi:hypothetical protein